MLNKSNISLEGSNNYKLIICNNYKFNFVVVYMCVVMSIYMHVCTCTNSQKPEVSMGAFLFHGQPGLLRASFLFNLVCVPPLRDTNWLDWLAQVFKGAPFSTQDNVS